jgi:hypothetical protein
MKFRARTIWLPAACVCVLGAGIGLRAGEVPPKPPRLEISLTDGSVIIGESSVDSVSVTPQGLGKMDVKLGFVDAISFSEDQKSANVSFRNGDRMLGATVSTNGIGLNTLVGPVTVPLGVMREIRVHPGGSGKVVDWDVLPFPVNCEWAGLRGEPAKVKADEIVLEGQPVLTRQSFSAPVSIEFDAALELAVSDDGCLWIVFDPDGAVGDPNVPPKNVAIQLGYQNKGEGGGMFTIADMNGAPVDLEENPFTFEAGKARHLEIEVTGEGIKATLDGKAYESKIVMPFKNFHIELLGWQPMNTWRVRDFVVR